MRIPALAILTSLTVLTSLTFVVVPVQAQTFAGDGAVCLHRWYWGGSSSYDCGYSSMEHCAAFTSALPATCQLNPYAASGQMRRRPATRQPRGGY
jgi:hypothetical protein